MSEYPDLLVCESTFYAILVVSEITIVVIIFFFFSVRIVSIFGWGGRAVTCWCLVTEEMLGLESLKVFLEVGLLVVGFFEMEEEGVKLTRVTDGICSWAMMGCH